MSHVKTKTIKLTEEEIDNFRAIADKFNVKFHVKQVKTIIMLQPLRIN